MAAFDAERFAHEEFGRSRLGHAARHKRLLRIATQLVKDPQASLPKVFGDRAQAKGLYRFASNRHVSHAAISVGHFEATAERARGFRRLLVPADTMHASLGGRDREGLGPVDTGGKSMGFLAHSALAIDAATRRPLGLLGQLVWARSQQKRPSGETQDQRKKRPREGEKWSQVARQVDEHLQALGEAKPYVIEIFDAEGDVFEAIETLDELGHGFIIRSCRDRLLEDEDDDKRYLVEAAVTAPLLGRMSVEVPARPGRAARHGVLELRSTTAEIRPPKNRHRKGDSIELSLVLATEQEVPDGVEPICWLLLTRDPATTRADAETVVRDYSTRWLIEEFHMGLKTGCSLEARQLQTFSSLTNLLAICNPIACGLLLLRHIARTQADAPAEAVLTQHQIKALRSLRPKVPAKLTAYAAMREIAMQGGFMGRKSDGEPGWRTLWLGLRDILLAERVLRQDDGSG